MKARAGSKALIREINEAYVLDIVRAQGPVSRAYIAAETGLSAATVTGISGRLLQAGLVIETEVVRDTGGRPARLLELGSDAVLAAGVRVSTHEAHAVLVNLRGDLVAEHRQAISSTAPHDVAIAITDAVQATLGQAPNAELLGVGVAVSGVVDQRGGVVRHSGSLHWEDVPLRALLRAQLDVPIVIDSYVNSLALGLLLYDSDFEGRDLLAFSVGASLGASIVVQGRIHRGFSGTAGGFAHSRTSFDPEMPRPCHCGGIDCLETRSSLWGIRRQLERQGHLGGEIDTERDAEVLADAAMHLGVAMANVSKIFAPERVIFAYSDEFEGFDFVPATVRAFRAQYSHEHAPMPDIRPLIAEPTAHARGAAYAVLARLFTADELDDRAVEPAHSVAR